MKRISDPIRMGYINIRALDRGALTDDTPLELDFLLDGQLVRRMVRMRTGFMTEAVLLDGGAHRLALRIPNGPVLCVADIPANGYSYLLSVDEPADFAATLGPMRPIEDTPHMDRVIRVLTRAMLQMLIPGSPLAAVYNNLQRPETDYAWFEFLETDMRIRYEPKTGCRVDVWEDGSVMVRPYPNVRLNVGQVLQLERALADALMASPAAEAVEFCYNDDGFLCARKR